MAKNPAIEPQGRGVVTEGLGAPLRRLLERRARAGLSSIVRLANGKELAVHDAAWGRDAGDLWEHVTVNASPRWSEPPHFFFLSEVAVILDPDTGAVLMEQAPANDECHTASERARSSCGKKFTRIR